MGASEVKAVSYYGKLPIVLLSEMAAGREDSYNCRIAAWLLAAAP